MSTQNATALLANLATAKSIFAAAFKGVLGGTATTLEVTIDKIYLDGALQRRLNSSSSSSSESVLEVHWTIIGSSAVGALLEAFQYDATLVRVELNKALAAAGFSSIVITSGPFFSGLQGATSRCVEWSVRASLISVLIGFFTLA
jgi:hypothetical protein